MKIEHNCYCDYLTLTTYQFNKHLQVKAIISGKWPSHGRRLSKRMQFDGWTVADGSIFSGKADIAGKPCYMFQASGAIAHVLLELVAVAGIAMKCTRIDLQRTVPLDLSSYSVLDTVEGTTHQTTSYIVNLADGTSTIYTGSRKSRKFARLYIKRLRKDWLRLEFELKRDYSRLVYDQIIMGGQESINGLYNGLVEKSKYPADIKAKFFTDKSGISLRSLQHEEELDMVDGYMQYLDNVHKSLENSLHDDTRCGPVAAWIRRQARMLDRFP